jgi:tetratricopeptide (TPR) repeat protein
VSAPLGASVHLARHYLAVHRPADALETLGALGGEYLEEPDFFLIRGRALADLDRHEEAKRSAEQGLALAPDDVELLCVLCDAERELGNLAAAERAILAALELAPDAPTLLCAYAHLCAEGHQMTKAGRLLARAERLDPSSFSVLRTHVWLAYLRDDAPAQRRHTARLLAEDPEDPLGQLMAGHDHYERGSTRRALRHFEAVARSDPADDQLANAAREMRVQSHWLFWPLWPVQRFGPMKLWLGFIATIVVTEALAGLWPPAFVLPLAAIAVYVPLAVYSWIVPPLARLWLRRRSRTR